MSSAHASPVPARITVSGLASRVFLVATVVFLAGFVALFLAGHARAGNLVFIDWWVYALATERLLTGQSLYLDMQVAGAYSLLDVTPSGYAYPPPSAILFVPFASWPVGLAAWMTLSVGLFVSGLAAILRREIGRVEPMALALVLLPLAVYVPLNDNVTLAPFFDGVVTGNLNVALAGVLAWTWAAGERLRWLPWVAGVVAVVKLFPGALALWAVRQYGYRALAVALGVFAVITIATLPLLGVEEWRRFVLAYVNAEATCGGSRLSVTCLAEPHLGPSLARMAALAMSAVLLALSLVVRSRYLAFVLLTIGMLASIHSLSQHYYLFFFVLAVIGAARLAQRRRARAPRPDVRGVPLD